MKKIGILGGTFDPIHIAHLIAADQALFYVGLDEIWFMPAPIPPHKLNKKITPVHHRVEMMKKVLETESRYKLCTIELERSGPSYTVDTMGEILEAYPNHSFYFIIGGDMIQYLPKWYKINELLQMVTFIGLERPGFPSKPRSLEEERVLNKVQLITMPQLEISSSKIRQWIKEGREIRYVVPQSVEQYIKEQGLYDD